MSQPLATPYLALRLVGTITPFSPSAPPPAVPLSAVGRAGDMSPAADPRSLPDSILAALPEGVERVFPLPDGDFSLLRWRSALHLPGMPDGLRTFVPLPHVAATDAAQDYFDPASPINSIAPANPAGSASSGGLCMPSSTFDLGYAFLARCVADTLTYRLRMWGDDHTAWSDPDRAPMQTFLGALALPLDTPQQLYAHYISPVSTISYDAFIGALAENPYASASARAGLLDGLGYPTMRRTPYWADLSVLGRAESLIGADHNAFDPVTGEANPPRAWARWSMRVRQPGPGSSPALASWQGQTFTFDLPYFLPHLPVHSPAVVNAWARHVRSHQPDVIAFDLRTGARSLASFAYTDTLLYPQRLGLNVSSVVRGAKLASAIAADPQATPDACLHAVPHCEAGHNYVLTARAYAVWSQLQVEYRAQMARDVERRSARLARSGGARGASQDAGYLGSSNAANNDALTTAAAATATAAPRYGRGRGRPPGVPNRLNPARVTKLVGGVFPFMRDSVTRWLAQPTYATHSPFAWVDQHGDGGVTWHDPTHGWERFTPLMPARGGSPLALPLSAVNAMHPDVLLWSAMLMRLQAAEATKRAEWFKKFPMAVVCAREGDVVHAQVLIPLPVNIVYAVMRDGIPPSLFEEKMPVLPHTAALTTSAGIPFRHATYMPPTDMQRVRVPEPIALPDLRRR